MKYFFPPINQTFRYLQTNLSDRLGSIWSSFNLDFITKRGTLKLANKLVINTSSGDDQDLGLPIAFEFFYNNWYAICGSRIFKTDGNLITSSFTESQAPYLLETASDTRFDITNPSGTTFRYTYDGTGTNPGITATLIPIGSTVSTASVGNFAVGNRGTFTVTGSGANYFEVTNASGTAEADKTIGGDYITVLNGSMGRDYSSTLSDMLVFNDNLWATSTTKLRKLTSGNETQYWRTIATLNSSVTNHKLVYFKKYDRLYFVDSTSLIKSVDTSDVVASSSDYTLDPTKSIGWISTMVASSSSIWIGGFSGNSQSNTFANKTKGTISQWDGFSNQVINEFIIETGGILSMCVLDDVPYAIDTSGRILKYSGYSFVEIARLPFGKSLLKNSTDNLSKWIHQNGFIGTQENTLLVLVNNLNEDANNTVNENFPSGIWELDLDTKNFTHKHSAVLKHLTEDTIKDYGQNRLLDVGALKLNTFTSDSTLGRSSLLAGIGYYEDETQSKYAIFIDSPYNPDTDLEGQKRGYFITTWFEANEITENFTRLWVTFKKFLTSTDKIIFKYRLNDEKPIEATITWTSTTTFTTTTDISDYEGYEAEIIQGTGGGACANILTVTEDSGTYTATIDTAITGVTGTAKARFQKWIKLGEITGQTLSYGQMPIIQNDTRIQIKGILEWTGDNEFHKMCVVSTDDIKITP